MRTAILTLLLSIFPVCFLLAQIPVYKPAYILGQSLRNPHDIIIGNDGLIYVADSYTTKAFDSSGTFKKEFHLKGQYNDWYGHIGLTQSKNGVIYTLTSWDNVVHKFTPDGEVTKFIGGKGTLPGQFNKPQGIVIDENGNLFIADTQNHRIQKFDKNGNVLKVFGTLGAGAGEFKFPTNLAIDSGGNLYVVDLDNNRIQIFDNDGIFVREINASNNSNLPFAPYDVTVDAIGNIYVTDSKAYKVLVFDKEGILKKSFGSYGIASGKFNSSQLTLAVDKDGNIYTAEVFNPTRIQKFTPDGNFILSFGFTGTEGELIDNPIGVVSDAIGNYFVADYISGLIKKFDKDGRHILTFGGRADKDGEFKGFLRGINMDKYGNVYVLSADAKGSVQKFNSRGEFISRFAPASTSGSSAPNAPFAPIYLEIDHEGYFYISDNIYLYKYDPAGGFVERFSLINPDTGNYIDFLNLPMIDQVPFKFDNTGLLYVSQQKGIKIYDRKGNFIRDFVPLEHPYGIFAIDIDFDDQNNMYVADWGYLKKFNPITGAMLATSSYHSFLLHIYGSDISVNASGSRVIVAGVYETITSFTYGTQHESANSKYITGTVFHDINENCKQDGNEKGIQGIIIETIPNSYYGISDKNGNYTIEVDGNTYTIAQVLPQTNGKEITEICSPTKQIEFLATENVVKNQNFGNQVTLSPYLTTSVSSTRRRRCFESTTKVTYSNTGFAAAENAKVYLQLPKEVELLSADKTFTRLPNGTYVFDVGTLAAGQTGTITIQDKVVCGDESIRGLTVCTKAWISTAVESKCPVVTTTAKCNTATGEVRVVIKNTGPEDMEVGELFRIYRNGQLNTVESYKLAAGDSLVLWIPAGGKTVRLEAEQPGCNVSNTLASVTIEGCKVTTDPAPVSTGFVNALPPDEEEPEVAEECLLITDSYDPNDKQVTPTGLTQENYTPTNTALTYKIRFQNTGTDVAYRVVVTDTLSEHLDISTLQLGTASHTYRYEVSGKGHPVLTWTFDNIMLPDSTTNEPGSHGYIQFSIKPKADLPEKTAVENFADIFFDFNSPVRTNTTINRIYDMPEEITETDRLDATTLIATPVLEGFSPASGKLGADVILTGKKFSAVAANNKVMFNGVQATVLAASENELKVQVPANATSGNIKVQTLDGAANSATGFEVYQPPVVSGFMPAEGIAGTTVTLQGNHLTEAWLQSIKLGDLACEIISISGNGVVVKVPAGANSDTFQVLSKGGQAQSVSNFIVWHQPAISNLSSVLDKVGATILITGSNFAPEANRNIIWFGAAKAQVLQATTTTLKVKVPAGATSGIITLETPGGTTQSPAIFEVIPAPKVFTFKPAAGSVGSEVELTGAHFLTFGKQDTITFNGQKAVVLEASPDQFKVRVPRGATSGKITVAGVGGQAITSSEFKVEELSPEQAIEVYPNPTNGNFTIRFAHADFEIQEIQLFSTLGTLVYSEKVSSPRPEQLDVKLTSPKTGIYILHIKTERGLVIKKLHIL